MDRRLDCLLSISRMFNGMDFDKGEAYLAVEHKVHRRQRIPNRRGLSGSPRWSLRRTPSCSLIGDALAK